MNWTAKLDQQQAALLTTFYMFTAMTLMVIRTGLEVRGVPVSISFTPYDDVPFDVDHLSSMQTDQLDQLYATALALLFAAELVARRLACIGREAYELMGQIHRLAQSLRDHVLRKLAVRNRADEIARQGELARAPPAMPWLALVAGQG